MPKAALVSHIGTAHDGFPPTPITAGSSTVKIDGIPAVRKGDPLAPHSKPKHPPHGRAVNGGSGSVMIDGKPAARIGDAVSCGGVIAGGSSVNIG